MMLRRTVVRLGAVAAALCWLSCGGGAPTLPITPAPTPVPTPAATSTPLVLAHCGSLAPGPVVRYAIAPRAARVNGENVPMRVWIQGAWQETWCLDKDQQYQIDFNSNQRNADGKESCFQNDPEWQIVDDRDRIVLGQGSFGDHGFNYRVGVDPRFFSASTTLVSALLLSAGRCEWAGRGLGCLSSGLHT